MTVIVTDETPETQAETEAAEADAGTAVAAEAVVLAAETAVALAEGQAALAIQDAAEREQELSEEVSELEEQVETLEERTDLQDRSLERAWEELGSQSIQLHQMQETLEAMRAMVAQLIPQPPSEILEPENQSLTTQASTPDPTSSTQTEAEPESVAESLEEVAATEIVVEAKRGRRRRLV